jgi:hypothetical protein
MKILMKKIIIIVRISATPAPNSSTVYILNITPEEEEKEDEGGDGNDNYIQDDHY